MTIVGVGIQKVITRDIALDCDSTTATAFRLLAITGGNVRLENLALNHGCVVDATGSSADGWAAS